MRSNCEVFQYLGDRDGKRYFYGVLADARLTSEQWDALEPAFICGLLAPGTSGQFVKPGLFGVLIGRGCRLIATMGPTARELEDSFDRAYVDAFHVSGVAPEDAVASTAHDTLSDLFVLVDAWSSIGAGRIEGSIPVYLLEIGAPTLEASCRAFVREGRR